MNELIKQNRELKIITVGETEYKTQDKYPNSTLTEAYAKALDDIKKYPNVSDWYISS
jgi:hypothetical protein